jgi:hypothetical protein
MRGGLRCRDVTQGLIGWRVRQDRGFSASQRAKKQVIWRKQAGALLAQEASSRATAQLPVPRFGGCVGQAS